MKRITYFAIISLASFSLTANAQQIKLSTVQPSVGLIAGVQNYVAIVVEGAPSVDRSLHMLEGPGQVSFDTQLDRWIWNWQPSANETSKPFKVVIRDAKADVRCTFTVRSMPFAVDRPFAHNTYGRFLSGIPTTIRAKQPGLDGEYTLTFMLDDSIVAQVNEPTLTIKPDLHSTVGRPARLTIDYTAPLTGKTVTLAEYSGRVEYPPLRMAPTLELVAGEPAFFKAALGLAPNFYTTVPSRFLVVKSDGYFEDTAQMITGWISLDNDPFGLFAQTVKQDSGQSTRFGFDFGLRQTDKALEITERAGKIVPLTFFDPITKQSHPMDVRIFPRGATTKD